MNNKKKHFIRILVGILCIAAIALLCIFRGAGEERREHQYNFIDKDATPETNAPSTNPNSDWQPTPGYAVSSSNDDATRTGMEVLANGGNAVDAAIAMSYVLGVVEPFSNGLGGSGGMMVYNSRTGEVAFYDYRACSGASFGGDAVAVPGFVAGTYDLHEEYGTIAMEDLIAPAIDYAENGFKVTNFLSSMAYGHSYLLYQHGEYLRNDGSVVQTGDTMYQPILAETLKLLQKEGPSVFYQGSIADDIIRSSSLTKEDLETYEVHKREALSCEYQGYTIYSANAPLSGLMLLQMMALSEKIDMHDRDTETDKFIEDLQTITRVAKSSRYRYVGDPILSKIDCQDYLTDEGLEKCFNNVVSYEEDAECTETTSFSVVDENGLVVTATNTLSDMFGSGIYVDGFWLNDTNSNFSAFGVNSFEPHKRSRTFTTPTIVVGNDGFVMAVGTPGGNKICGILFLVLSDILKNGEDYQTAVNKPRYVFLGEDFYAEIDDNGESIMNKTQATRPVIFVQKGYSWGSVALAGKSKDGAFSAFDTRRGATYAGVYNEGQR